MELIFDTCGEFLWNLEGPVSQIHSPHLHAGVPGNFSTLLRSVEMLRRKLGVESNGKLPHVFVHGKTAALVPALTVKDLPLGGTLRRWWWYIILCLLCIIFYNVKLHLNYAHDISNLNILHLESYYVFKVINCLE